ncbi:MULTISPECIES: hypothetical protein [unclassified Rhizobium]|uniref:hypothetical protein n=1 Tax=unclassified Rhizobium TaxID=2613769 RepID=UPI00160F0E7D|nr:MULTISPECIES: hypothetical protein [unclassified Rhizobium]MBB3521005.1 hypothetical protein [Rhizobium sp. BK456]MDR6664035.1 hypothetical protein [Rhizobium sp. 1399]
MAEFEGHTKLLCPALGIGWQTAFNLSVEMQPISGSAIMTRDWNGKMVNLADPMFRLYAIRISSGADDLRPPALAGMWPGEVFTVVPPSELCVVIPVGSSTAIFPRQIHTARAITLGFDHVAMTFADKTATLSAPATEVVRVYATMEHEVMVIEPWQQTFREAEAQYSWQISTEEVGGF